MRKYNETTFQRTKQGWTLARVITAADDFTESTDNTDQTLTLGTLAMGDVVLDAMLEVRTAIGNASANMTLAASLGVTGATTQFIGASTLVNAGTPAAANTVFCPANTFAAYPTPSGGKSILLTLDITDADGHLSACATGELWVWLKIDRAGDRALIVG